MPVSNNQIRWARSPYRPPHSKTHRVTVRMVGAGAGAGRRPSATSSPLPLEMMPERRKLSGWPRWLGPMSWVASAAIPSRRHRQRGCDGGHVPASLSKGRSKGMKMGTGRDAKHSSNTRDTLPWHLIASPGACISNKYTRISHTCASRVRVSV